MMIVRTIQTLFAQCVRVLLGSYAPCTPILNKIKKMARFSKSEEQDQKDDEEDEFLCEDDLDSEESGRQDPRAMREDILYWINRHRFDRHAVNHKLQCYVNGIEYN